MDKYSQLPHWESIGHALMMEGCFIRLQEGLSKRAYIIQPLPLTTQLHGPQNPNHCMGLSVLFSAHSFPVACHSAAHSPRPGSPVKTAGSAVAIELFPDWKSYFPSAKTLTDMDLLSGTRLQPTFQIRSTPTPSEAWSSSLRASVLAASRP